jgi:hypothetical protein
MPPSQPQSLGPGILQSQIIIFSVPLELERGLALKLWGWSLRHALRSAASLQKAKKKRKIKTKTKQNKKYSSSLPLGCKTISHC